MFFSAAKSVCHIPQHSQECMPLSMVQPRVCATFLSTAKHEPPCSVQPRICHIPELGIVRGRVMFIWMTKCQWIFAHFLLVTASNPRHLRQRTEPESPSKTTPAQRERKCCIQGRSGQAEGSFGQKGKNSKPQHQGGGNSTSKWQHPEGEGKYNCDKSGVSNRKSQSKTINCTHSKRKGKKSDHYQKVNQDGLYNQNVEE